MEGHYLDEIMEAISPVAIRHKREYVHGRNNNCMKRWTWKR